ncbi:HNH endonuclease [Methylorubrum aminovorans]|uniref:HNH endonuclease n=1 Tax=Methylorubrum aminovorans TaxID=269069 RepID=UPI003570DAD8
MIWKSIPGYADYEVSEIGDVRRIRGGQNQLPYLLKKYVRRGYFHVGLFNSEGICSPKLCHRLVALAFLGPSPCQSKSIVAHRNGLRRCNHHSNLYWATYKENSDDREAHGRTVRGERTSKSKLVEMDVIAIRASNDETKVLAIKYDVDPVSIRNVRNRKTWRHIP